MSDPSALKRLHRVRFTVTCSVALLLFAAWMLWRDPTSLGLSALAAVAASHAFVGVRGRPTSISVGLWIDAVAFLIGVAVIRPPTGAIVGLVLYAGLAAIAFAPRRTALAVILTLSAGTSAVLGGANILFPRSWSGGALLGFTAVAIVVSVAAVGWLVGVVADALAERGALQDRLAASESLHRRASRELGLVLDSAAEGIYGVDLHGICTFANQSVGEILGYDSEQLVGMRIHDAVHRLRPDGLPYPASECVISKIGAGEPFSSDDEFFVAADGSLVPVAVNLRPILDSSGEAIGQVVSFRSMVDDIAARRQAIFQASLLDSVASSVFVTDFEGMVTLWNKASVDMYGWTQEEALGRPIYELVRRTEASMTAGAPITEILEHGSWRGEMDVVRRDGSPFTVMTNSVLLRDVDGTPLAVMGAGIDVTEQKKVRDALEDLVASKDRFVAMVSHEFRTPLTVVLGLAEELRDGEFAPDEMQEFHGLIADQARDLSYMVEDLLAAARAQAGSISVVAEEVDVADAVGTVLASLPSDLAEGVELEAAQGPVYAIADPARIRQVVRNLVTNAVRHGAFPVAVSVGTHGGSVVVEVLDHGAGVPALLAQSLFSAYANAPSGEAAGESTGIGLFVSRQLIRLMGGDLTYERRSGVTVFRLTVPSVDHETVRIAV